MVYNIFVEEWVLLFKKNDWNGIYSDPLLNRHLLCSR
jgi:hypothetical protein